MGSEATEVDRSEEEEKRGTKREKGEDELEEEGSTSKRPSRERKKVERYSAFSPKKASASKALSIEQGSGTMLRDIPNVVFKLLRRKVDDNLQALHAILFGKKSNAYFLKRNILQFSGFVWTENEEKRKAKLKEKLDKYTKEKLIDFCGLLDIQFPKSTTKKDVSAKLLEFLESPHVTRDLLLSDKDKKGKKRRSRTKAIQEAASADDASSDKETKKRKRSAETKVKKGEKQSPKTEEEFELSGGSDSSKYVSSGEGDKNYLEAESDHDKLDEIVVKESEEPLESMKSGRADEIQPEDASDLVDKGRASPTKMTVSVKPNKSPSKHVSKKTADETDVATDSKHGSTKEQAGKSSKAITKEKAASVNKEKKKFSRKNATVDASDSGLSKSSKSQKVDKKKGMSKGEAVVEGKKARKKKEAKPATKVSTKGQGKGKKNAGPSTEELHSVISTILKEVDFNTATMADILKQLGSHFKMDLMDRKAEVKSIIEDVINNMTDDDGDDDGDEDEDNLGDKEEESKSEGESD